jgi:hypothetical protein
MDEATPVIEPETPLDRGDDGLDTSAVAPVVEAEPEAHTTAAVPEGDAESSIDDAPEPRPEAEPPATEPEPVSESDAEASAVDSGPEPEPDAQAEVLADVETKSDQLSLDEMVESLKASDDAGDEAAEGGDEPSQDVAVEASAAAATPSEAFDAPTADGLARDRLAARLPFGVYVGLWAAFAGAMGYLLWPAAAKPFVDSGIYAYSVLGGVALTLAGPLLGLAVWLLVRSSADVESNAGLVRAVFMRAALSTLAGDLLWWLGLVLLDLHRAGVLG